MLPLVVLAFANERQNDAQYLRALSDERRAIEAALSPTVKAGLCEVKTLPNATLGEIFDLFQDERYRDRVALFHYGGHAGSFELLLEKSDRENAAAHRTGLVPFLGGQRGLEMVFLNGCSTEQWALALNDAGIPIVAGTFKAIRDDVARLLATRFYMGFGQGLPIRRAWDEAVAHIRADSGDRLRSIAFEDTPDDRFPWELFLRKGAERAGDWNLPDAAGDPLASFPLPPQYQQIPLPNEPFRFLDRYKKADAPIFFGRSHETRDLCDRLTNPLGSPVVLLSGQSGVGKSSLLEAGLLPRLEGRYSVLYQRRNPSTGLLGTLYAALNGENTVVSPEHVLIAWKKIEQQVGKPLICIIDQTEEAFTHAEGKGMAELEAFVAILTALFGNPFDRPSGKLLLGFRKEYEPEIKDTLLAQQVPFELVFLKRLSRQGILEVVRGLTTVPRLAQKYGLEIEDGLAETMAADLLADSDTPVSPVLQITLTKLWQGLPSGEPRRFTQAEYLRLKEDGIFLGDFFRQQMEQIQAWEKSTGNGVESSGLALDVLNSHATDFGFANSLDLDELKRTYQHRADVLDDLVRRFKSLYLLTDAGERRNALAHDTLAPIVQQAVKNSQRPGQKALRILAGKTANYRRNPQETILDPKDLALVEEGRSGMRIWAEGEAELVKKSQAYRQKIRRQRWGATIALVFLGLSTAWLGWQTFQRKRIEQWVSRARLEAIADPTLALQTIQNALRLAPENPAVLTSLNDVWSNNEFYMQRFEHPDMVKGVLFAPDSTKDLYSWTPKNLYRWSSSGGQLASFSAQGIQAVTLSPDGRYLAVATETGLIAYLDALTLRQIRQGTPFPPDQTATHLVCSADGRIVLAIGTDQQALSLDASNPDGEKGRFLLPKKVTALAADHSRGELLLGYEDGTGEARDWAGRLLRALPRHADQVLAFAVSPTDMAATSGGRDAQILFNKTGGLLTVKGHDRRINALTWGFDGGRLLSASHDKTIKAWSPQGDLLSIYKGHTDAVNTIALAPDGQRFASASDDRTVRIWKIESKVRQRYGPHNAGVSSVFVDKDPSIIWASTGGNDLLAAEFIIDPDANASFLKDALLGTGRKPHHIQAWDIATGKPLFMLKAHKGAIADASMSSDGALLLSTSDDSSALVWQREQNTFRPLPPLRCTNKVAKGVFAPDGKTALTGSFDSVAVLWDWVHGGRLQTIKHPDAVSCVAFLGNGSRFVTGCYDGIARLFDLHGNKIRDFSNQTAGKALPDTPSDVEGFDEFLLGTATGLESVVFSPDGQWLLTGERSDTLRVWNVENGQCVTKTLVPAESKTGVNTLHAIVFSPNGKLLAVAAEGGIAQIFRFQNGQLAPLLTLRHYPRHAILSLCFSLDGKSLFTAGADGWARCWDLDFLKIF